MNKELEVQTTEKGKEEVSPVWSPTGRARGPLKSRSDSGDSIPDTLRVSRDTCNNAPMGATSRPPAGISTTMPPTAEGRGAMAGLQQTNQQIQQLSNRLDQLQASLDCWAKRSQTEYSGKAPSSSSNNLLVAITLLVLFLLATAGVLFYREYAHVPNVVPLVQNPLPQNTALARQPLVTFPEYTETLVAEETPMPIEEAQASAPEPPPSESQPTIAEETPNSSETQSAIVEETPIVKTQEKAQVEVEPAIPAMEEANASEPKEDAEAAESLTPVMTPETQLSETAREPNHSIIQPMNGYFSL